MTEDACEFCTHEWHGFPCKVTGTLRVGPKAGKYAKCDCETAFVDRFAS